MYAAWEVSGATAILHPDNLAAVRFELVAHAGMDCGWLDLAFQREEATVVLPGVLVDPAIAAKGSTVWLWPQRAVVLLGDEHVDVIVDVVAPWLRRLTQERVIPLRATLTLRAGPAFEFSGTAADFGGNPYG